MWLSHESVSQAETVQIETLGVWSFLATYNSILLIVLIDSFLKLIGNVATTAVK